MLAHYGLLALVALSVLLRPLVSALGLPDVLVNLDAIAAVPLAGAVALLVAWGQRSVRGGARRTAAERWTAATAYSVLVVCALAALSWVLGSPRSWASFGLAYASVLLTPLVLLLVVVAPRAGRAGLDLVLLRGLVLLQLVVGLAQYLANDVAAQAPFAADLIDGTSSHNLWPAVALPAAIVLARLEPVALGWLWPTGVALLAVYSEAKAALLLWAPAILLVAAALLWVHHVRPLLASRAGPRPLARSAHRVVLVAAAAGVALGGLWYSPSVEGTWEVLQGHTHALDELATNPDAGSPTAGPGALTIRDALDRVRDELTRGPDTLLLGLGPANSVSHGAAVLAQGPANGSDLPAPGPLASELLEGDVALLGIEDPQSSVLGLVGDLGLLGVLGYLAAVVAATGAMLVRTARGAAGRIDALTVVLVVGGLGAGGLLLDWPEQAGVVLPLALVLLVTVRGGEHRARAGA